ncbi:MAG TPA: helix-hairpin-helix domain-containing protein [Burkholderiaceae bacterium]|jgi:competence protein ComEA|nr:helix-hairpin-helix domain-containing protein [Burkholderiaceae bacterium]
MNPFLESTVAAPRPAACWHPLSRRAHRAGPVLRALMLAGTLLAPGAAAAIDVNVATSEQLQEVKGIGPKMARVIIEERERGGQFASIADLSDRVKGIGPKKAAAMQESGLTVGQSVAAAAVPEKSSRSSPGRRAR